MTRVCDYRWLRFGGVTLFGLAAALGAGCDAQGVGAADPSPHYERRVDPSVVHYDFVDDNGQLAGGQVRIDLADIASPEEWEEATYPFEAIRSSGPPDNRIDLVLVGDGYTSSELDLYRQSAADVVAAFFASEALRDYAHFFNVHRVDVVSRESGVDHDLAAGELKDTALDGAYGCQGIERLLCVNVRKALAAARSAPDVDQVLVLANSFAYGGAGYPKERLGTVAGQNEGAIEIALHEFGHAFAGLADEYGGAALCFEEPSAPNVSLDPEQELSANRRKWYRWLDEPSVGAFEGGQFCDAGMYRPTVDSKMRTLGKPFEAVNNEQFVIHFYKHVRPIDDATPHGIYGRDAQFFVKPVGSPTTRIQWFADGEPIAGADGETFDAAQLPAFPDELTLSVRVIDETPYVRDELSRRLWLTEERDWLIGLGHTIDASGALPETPGALPERR